MYNYTYTPVTVKVVCTILYSPETSLQWAATHLTLNCLALFGVEKSVKPPVSGLKLSRRPGLD